MEIKLNIPVETFEQLQKIAFYINQKLQRSKRDFRITVDQLIEISINRMLKHYEMNFPSDQELKLLSLNLDLPIKNKFKEYMEKQNPKITQSYLAQMCGTSVSNINLILNNEHQPTLELFFRIWANLGYPPLNEILYREEPVI